MDMASGAQTIANGGLHHEPYYVEWIDTADGRRIYTHADAGTQVLDPGVALTAIDTLKGVLRTGTGRNYPLADGRPAAGKTGTQADNTNAWFVGFTPAAHDGRLGRRPERLHADGQRARVRRRQRARVSRAAATRRRSGRRTWTPRWPGQPFRTGSRRRHRPARRRASTCPATSASFRDAWRRGGEVLGTVPPRPPARPGRPSRASPTRSQAPPPAAPPHRPRPTHRRTGDDRWPRGGRRSRRRSSRGACRSRRHDRAARRPRPARAAPVDAAASRRSTRC